MFSPQLRACIFSASSVLVASQHSQASELTNYNDPNSSKLVQAFQQRHLHVVQFGDSHTAADVFTDHLRVRLQSALGNGGMGWAMPMYFSGQRLTRFGYDNTGWSAISSRTQSNENYGLGGLIAMPQYNGASLTLKPKLSEQRQTITVSLRQAPEDGEFVGTDAEGQSFHISAPIKNNHWQTTTFSATLPFTIKADNANHSAIGGWWAKNSNNQGAVVSALGINGAELSYWNRWSNDWKTELGNIAPDLIILAYGTNEAYNDHLDITRSQTLLTEKIAEIRHASPNSAILIVSAPESLKKTSGQCGVRPIKLDAMQAMQQQVAQTSHTLYWDWQQAMGGRCSMQTWIKRGDGRNDGVHFTASGYQKLGNMLANDLLNFAGQSNTNSVNQTQAVTRTANQFIATSPGYAQICNVDTNDCKTSLQK
ncbi:GDSL-type esterase/lipase family protein [Acinetobacter sp. MD2(2019)]|uniref:GDSL-type esterase/lipase family protein n=1 Tax=Acinetobacter sp. MD2(2019) TaxID=2605273 RepID=UPI002D1EC7D8|nr:GDSL-type esterase/lipase family protein [Acinetobacter sp. MD2(2019)]MEB3753316.1 hypothetical protein [Acinetobacter sp. MD2(2019)]